MTLPDSLLAHIAEKLGERSLASEATLSGKHNDNHVVRGRERYVVRVFSGDEDAFRREWTILNALDGEFAPKPLYMDVSRTLIDETYFVEEYIGDAKRVDALSENVLRELGRALRVLHERSAGVNYFAVPVSRFAREVFMRVPLSPSTREFVLDVEERLIAELAEELSLQRGGVWIHGDPTMPNIMRSGDRFLLVDWEFARPAHYLEDFAAVIVEHRLLPEDAEIFLSAYGVDSPPPLLDAFILRRLLDAYAWTVDRLHHDSSPELVERVRLLRDQMTGMLDLIGLPSWDSDPSSAQT